MPFEMNFRLPGPGWRSASSGVITAALVVFTLGAIPADADVVPAGKRAARYCVRFMGLESWPEWKFMTYTDYGSMEPYRSGTSPRVEEVGSGTCIGIRSLTLGSYDIVLVAVPQKEFSGGISVADAAAGAFPRSRVRIERGFGKGDDGILTLPDRVWLEVNSMAERVEEVVKVDTVGPAGIGLKRGERWQVYPDGAVKVVAAETTSRSWVFAAGVLVFLSLVALRAVRRIERRRGGHPLEGP